MAVNRVDWALLRAPLVVFVLTTSLCAAMVTASYTFRGTMEAEYQQKHLQSRKASEQYLSVDKEERIIQTLYPDFVRLHRAGLLGREQRLSWLETLRQAGDAMKLPELNYKLDAQRAATPDFPINLGAYSLLVSPMNLKLGLLHEGDLLALFDVLDRNALGEFSVRSCSLKRREQVAIFDLHTPNLTAECVLDWWTINLPGGRELAL